MTFERPDLLWAVLAGVLLSGAALWAQWRRGLRLRDAVGGRQPARRLLGHDPGRWPGGRWAAALVAVGMTALVGAGPRPAEPEPTEPADPIDLLIAVDVSHSMSAEDVAPSRAARARQLVEEIVASGAADRVALTLFASWPFGLVPLTDDGDVVDFFSPWVTPELVANRDQGTSLASVLGYSRAVWQDRPREESNPIVLIISDGEAHGDDVSVLDSTRALVAEGVSVWTAGVGSVGGAPLFVPGSDGAPLLDADGEPVIAEFAPGLLDAMAEESGGTYHDISSDGGLRGLLGDLRRESGTEESMVARSGDPLFWLLLIGLLAAATDAVLDTGRHRGRREESA